MYMHHWSIVDVAPLEVLESFSADGVEEQERGLTHEVAKVVKVAKVLFLSTGLVL